ncbi:MAG: hypothetical protein LBV54_03860 [Puniceicoccales bacterium]|jgi:hypothetical protein|nr:hypothetical protein [Puniceicoccales bacterium]
MRVERLDLAVQSDALHLFAVREGLVSASTTVNYAIVSAPLGEFRFSVPAEVRNLEFAGKDIRAWKRDGDTLTVSLHKPVSGAFTLLGTYDLPLDPRGGTVSLTGLRPLGVQTEQGFVLVTSDLQFNVKNDTVSPNLTPVEPGEIPAEYRMMFDASLLAAYQYAARPYDLKLGLQLRPQSNTLNQVVDFASLSTRVSHDGQIVTEARYLVKSHGHPHLRLTPPAGLKLWTARVDNADVLPVTDAATTLIPLPARPDANTLLTVDLRFAGTAADTAKIRLDAPALGAPIINTRWEVTPDKETSLNPIAGNLAQEKPNAPPPLPFQHTRSGKILVRLGAAAIIAVSAALFFFLGGKLRTGGRRKIATGFGAIGLIAILGTLALCWYAATLTADLPAPIQQQSPAPNTLVFTSPIHPGSADILATTRSGDLRPASVSSAPETRIPGAAPHFIELRRETASSPAWSILGHLALLLLGAALAFSAFAKKSPALRAITWTYFAVVIFAAGDSHAGWLALLSAAFFFFEILLPGLRCFRAVGTSAAALLALALFAGHAAANDVPYNPDASRRTKLADRITQEIIVSEKQTSVDASIEIRGKAGDRFDLLLQPAVLIGVSTPPPPRKSKQEPAFQIAGKMILPEGVRLEKITRNTRVVIQLVLEKDCAATLDFRYELPLGVSEKELKIPTGRAVSDMAGVEIVGRDTQVTSPEAAAIQAENLFKKYQTIHPDGSSAFTITFLPRAERTIRWAPKARDRRTEPLVIYAESTDLYIPSLGVLDGHHTLKIRPAQGLLREVNVRIPAGLSVANVTGTGVKNWRFDPEKQRLTIPIEPGQANETTLTLETQMGIGALPQKLTLAPLTVEGTAGQVGMVALGTADDVQITTATPQKMLAVANDDFQQSGNLTHSAVKLRRSFRYSDPTATLVVTAEAVQAEVRLESQQRISLGEDRIVLNANWAVDITRAGIFRLTFDLPEGLDIESISGSALSHWTETPDAASTPRRVILHLRGRTLGHQNFTLTFSGPGIAGKKKWHAPRLLLHEATRQTGALTLVSEEGLRLHVATRTNATQYDPGTQARLPKSALAFRLPQRDWALAFDIENLAPWIQATYLQDITVRDSQIRALVNFEYTIENAATKTLHVQLPADATGVRFTGPLVADAVEVKKESVKANAAGVVTESTLWQVRLTRRALGKTTLHVTYQRPLGSAATTGAAAKPTTTLHAITAADANLQHGWLALRTTGRLELKPGPLPSALTASDWQAVPVSLRRGLAEPVIVLRKIENAFTLPLAIVTHDPAKLLALRIEAAELLTMLSDEHRMLTRVHLTARLAEKGLLRVTLPANATYWHGFVNNEPVRVALDGTTHLIPVAPNADPAQAATIEFYYAAPTSSASDGHKLEGPRFDVPLQNIVWRVQLPDGRILAKHQSDLRLASQSDASDSGHNLKNANDYIATNNQMLSRKYRQAEHLIALGNKLKGSDQVQAAQALSQAQNLSSGNAALNEDARVQLNTLRQSQIEVGMNRWRQNFANNAGNFSVSTNDVPNAPPAFPAQTNGGEQSVNSANVNFTQEEVLLQRSQNTAEENEVTRKMAERFLTQQTTAAGALDSIRTLIPAQSRTLRFERTLQVGTGSDLSLNLTLAPLEPVKSDSRFWPLVLLALAALALSLVLPRLRIRQ